MKWDEANVNPMHALRNVVCNDRWTEAWAVIEQGLQQQVVGQRQNHRTQRRAIPPAPSAAPPPTPLVVMPAPHEPEVKPPHPWKRAWSVRHQRELADAA